jgi:hypothetical protein
MSAIPSLSRSPSEPTTGRFFLRLVLWASLAFVACWPLRGAWQGFVGGAGAYLAAPRGTSIEITDMELFFPFDVGVYLALCLASTWAAWPRRARAMVIGVPVLVVLEIATVAISLRVMLGASDPDAAARTVDSVTRICGLIAAVAVWLVALGGERLSLEFGRTER